MSDEKERRSRAKFNTALDAMKPALQAASEAAHEIEFADDDEAGFERLMQLGELVENAGMLCPHDLRLLNEIAYRLMAIHEGEHESVEAGREQHLH
jgi:hypothetical protein